LGETKKVKRKENGESSSKLNQYDTWRKDISKTSVYRRRNPEN
jgi:hypothetical protein